MDSSIDHKGKFLWRVVAAHVFAYTVAGLFAVAVLDYESLYAVPPLSHFMKQLNDPMVALAPVLQLFRGAILAFVLWYFRRTLLAEKYGHFKIALLILGLSYISTVGPVLGSFDGYVFTTFPIRYHLLGLPETLIYVFVFSSGLWLWYQKEPRWFNTIAIIWIALMSLFGILGAIYA